MSRKVQIKLSFSPEYSVFMATQYTKEFKKDAIKDWEEHKYLGINVCAKNLSISKSALSTWKKLYECNEGNIPTRGMGNYESNSAKENAGLKRELRDALEILKKGKRHTWKLPEAIYLEAANKDADMRKQGGRRLNASSVLRQLAKRQSVIIRGKWG